VPLIEPQLIEKAQKGDHQAFRVLVEREMAKVRTTVIGMLGNAPESDDIVQEVFIRFYKSLAAYKGESKLSTYLVRIAINLSINELKKRKQDQQRWIPMENHQEQLIQLEDSTAHPRHQENQELVRWALQQLPTDFRSVIVLRLIDGYSVEETATILQLPHGTVASRLARAQVKLKAILKTLALENY
jgi:RNA polymerase sigma-70 factor (ECF subfamily)